MHIPQSWDDENIESTRNPSMARVRLREDGPDDFGAVVALNLSSTPAALLQAWPSVTVHSVKLSRAAFCTNTKCLIMVTGVMLT